MMNRFYDEHRTGPRPMTMTDMPGLIEPRWGMPYFDGDLMDKLYATGSTQIKVRAIDLLDSINYITIKTNY